MLHLDTTILITLVVAVPVICLICLYISHNVANKKVKFVASVITWVFALLILSVLMLSLVPMPYSICTVVLVLALTLLFKVIIPITQKVNGKKDEQTPDEPAKNDDSIEQLEKLAELKDKGVISEEEFEQKKADLLAKI